MEKEGEGEQGGGALPCVGIDFHPVLVDLYNQPEVRHEGALGFQVTHYCLLNIRITATTIIS